MLFGLIVACEVAFWVLLVAGLAVRYLLRRQRLGGLLLLAVPVVDLVLLVASVVDLRDGGRAELTHGLAAAYLGFSVAFGHDMVRWADARFAHRFAGGPPPDRRKLYGRERARYEWRAWGKGVIGWAVACGLLLAGVALVGDLDRSAALLEWAGRLTFVMVVWLVFWPVAYTLFPKRAPRDAGTHQSLSGGAGR
ncbi:hypothetical protein [Microbispora sp. H13382]|uniref:hypothetical protein n=1 Tax=Microbispora sp. H13382 TaxID=2729112 RepID=UPI00160228DD|nr:hypothetical protein [Microbispora sp. H13382]